MAKTATKKVVKAAAKPKAAAGEKKEKKVRYEAAP